jgi:thiol-disulfide isomerase/thioredoxin
MSQCFSGSFYGITGALAGDDGLPSGATCGYFSSTRNRPAYGCYPENLGRENVGHSFDFFQGLARTGSFAAAHRQTLVEDATPDVPLRTSDQFLHALLLAEASRRGVPLWVVVDEMLTIGWRDRARWEPQIRLLDRIGDAFGFFSPRSLSELREQKRRLPKISSHLRNVSLAWKAALGDANRAQLRRFLADEPAWKERLDAEALRRLDPAGLEALGSELAAALATHAARDPGTDARRTALHVRGEDAADASYRMEVRLAAVLRMRMVLIEVAGQTWLEQRASDAERAAHAALVACEDAIRLPAGIELPALAAHEPFPPFDEDVARATAALPAWMGIRFRGVPAEQRKRLGIAAGAAQVLTVFPDSPAAAAGLEAGDIVLGPPDAPFSEFREVRAWTMLSEIGIARPLAVLRSGQPLSLNLTPASFPVEWPSLPGPPKVGDAAPPLQVSAYRGDPASVVGRPHILFFWATWCLPCKAALPRLLEIEAATGMPVVAVTDEPRETLDAFFAQVEAFPHIVAIDDLRQTHQAWGVSGTPTFAFVGGDGTVRQLSVGFSAGKGLPLPDPTATE